MKKTCLIFVPWLLAVSLWAQPDYFNYQGLLKDNQGEPLDTGAYQMEFSIYDAAVDGVLIWGPFLFDDSTDEGHSKLVQVANGKFNVILGPTDTASRNLAEVFSGDSAYVQLRVGNGDPILPRQQILSTPYAFRSTTAGSANSAVSATTADSATTAGSASELTGLEWNAPAGTATISIDGTEKVKIGNPVPNSGNFSLHAHSGHSTVDTNFGFFSANLDAGSLSAGFDTDNSGIMYFWALGTHRMNLRADRLLPNGNDKLYLGDSNNRWKRVYSVSSDNISSDERLKRDIKDLDYGLDEVLEMRPAEFKWKDESDGPTHIGLIAQELQGIIPEVVEAAPDEEGTLGVTYSELIPVLINATKDQQELIESLRSENQSLEDRLQALETKLEEL